MPKTYRATIYEGNRIEWKDEIPPEILAGESIEVFITVIKPEQRDHEKSDTAD